MVSEGAHSSGPHTCFLLDLRVVLGGATSDSASVLSGVHQGTVLGPILFLIYLTDLPDGVVNSTVRLFADDYSIYLPIRCSKGTVNWGNFKHFLELFINCQKMLKYSRNSSA